MVNRASNLLTELYGKNLNLEEITTGNPCNSFTGHFSRETRHKTSSSVYTFEFCIQGKQQYTVGVAEVLVDDIKKDFHMGMFFPMEGLSEKGGKGLGTLAHVIILDSLALEYAELVNNYTISYCLPSMSFKKHLDKMGLKAGKTLNWTKNLVGIHTKQNFSEYYTIVKNYRNIKK